MMKNLVVPEIKKSMRWGSDDVRAMCIRHDFYTHGDVEAYSDMLCYVDAHRECTDADIYKVAFDIVAHSDMSWGGQTEDENIMSVMFDLQSECVHTFFEI